MGTMFYRDKSENLKQTQSMEYKKFYQTIMNVWSSKVHLQ